MKDLLPITEAQADEIHRRLMDCGADLSKFRKVFAVEKIADLKAGQLKEVYVQIERQSLNGSKAAKDAAV